MSSSFRPRALPHCSSCVRNYLSAGFGELAAPTNTALRQQVRGKKKMANTSSALPVRLLKNVDTFGRKGAIVPISHGQMRNDWLPRRIAEYVTLPERKTLRANDVAIERDFDFRLNSLITPTITTLDPATEAARGGMTATAKEEASMFQRRTLDPARLSPERSMELLEIFIPSRGLEFYRQPIIEEKEPEPAPAPEPRKPS
ncbi:hypothetical protein B0A55_08589, partial [Friedmanniomyces simplex]